MGVIKVNFGVAMKEDSSVGAAIFCDSLSLVIGAKIMQTIVKGVLEGEVFAVDEVQRLSGGDY